ncbi:MAG: hypothetical protein KatS3mg114_1314 [Planctomycetaceae bacterium]|nr:MAG: hypothetical protein KatS3mg114_1314 [Planctomycetaceae bacterium]
MKPRDHDDLEAMRKASQSKPSPTERENEMLTHMTKTPVARSREQTRLPELTDQLEKDLVQVFKLLADETRLRILMYLLKEGELHVTALCDRLGQSQPAVSHHLALLRVAGLIEPRRDGKHNFYSIKSAHFHKLIGELFRSMTDPNSDELRLSHYTITQNS